MTYTRAVTEAYMLAYYPHYVGLTKRALDVLPAETLRNDRVVRVCAFACGPAPEPVAVAQHLVESGHGAESLRLALLDIVPERWEWARSVSINGVLPLNWRGETRVVETASVDITAPTLLESAGVFVERSDLVLFQNCLNEFPADQLHVQDNAEALLSAMRPGAVLLVADINNYPTGRACLDTFAAVAERKAEVLHRPEELLTVAPAPDRPAVLDEHFFLDGEFPRKKHFEFRCLAARVREG